MNLCIYALSGHLVVGLLMMVPAVGKPRTARRLALQKIYESGVIRIGHREEPVPFPILDGPGGSTGYSLNLCDVVVEQVECGLP